MSKILLSICIPTYNRVEYLEKTILSIVNQKLFQDTTEIEIIISDNCSTDNTQEISNKYIEIYGDKIRYYRNSENILDLNFEKALSYGSGVFLKLNNDTLLHQNNTLDVITDKIKINIENKDIIFFSNSSLKNTTEIYCKDLDSYVKTVSYYSTWVACFGIWKEDFDSIRDFSRKVKLGLVQTDVLLRLIFSGKSVWVYNTKIFTSLSPKTKGGYNIYHVFVTNYLRLLEEYRDKKRLSRFTLFTEKSRLLIHFIIPWTITIQMNKKQFSFDKKGAFSIIFKKYFFHPILYFGIVYLIFRLLQFYIKKTFRKYIIA